MNGDLINEVSELLKEEGQIKTPVALRLTLEMLKETLVSVQRYCEKHDALEKKVEGLERSSIVIWIQKHPVLFTSILLAYLAITAFVDIRQILAYILKVPLP